MRLKLTPHFPLRRMVDETTRRIPTIGIAASATVKPKKMMLAEVIIILIKDLGHLGGNLFRGS